jgi:outer membrane protein
MKRSYIIGATVALTMMLAGQSSLAAQTRGAAQPQATKLAFVNSQRILAQAPGAAEAEQTFERDMGRFRQEVDQLRQQIERAGGEFEQQQATMRPADRTARQEQLQQQFQSYQQRVAELERTAQRRQAELVEPIMKRISDTIEEIRTSGGYAMIFDSSAGGLITADPSLDLTDQVLQRLRATSR